MAVVRERSRKSPAGVGATRCFLFSGEKHSFYDLLASGRSTHTGFAVFAVYA